MQEADKQNVQNILQRLKTLLNINTDIELAYRLHLNSSNILTNWRRRNTMDYNLIIAIAATNKIDLNYLLTGNQQTSNPLYFGEGRAEAFHVHDPQAPYHIQIITVNQNNQDAITIVPHKVAAGYLNGYADPEFIESLPTISAPGYSGGVHRGFEIRGNSMPPLHPGSYSIGRYVQRPAEHHPPPR